MQTIELIGINLERILAEKGMSKGQAERLIGLSNGVLSAYCRGRYYPTTYLLCQIADKLQVDVREFFRPQKEISTMDLFKGMSESMQTAVTEIMKVTQRNDN